MSRSSFGFRCRLLAASAALIATAGCVRSDVRVERGEPPTTLAVLEVHDQLDVGDAVRSPKGVTIGLVEVATDRHDEAAFGVRIEVCAGLRARQVIVDPTVFQLVTDDRKVHSVAGPMEGRSPVLHPLPVARGECHIGWLTFRVTGGGTPALLVSSATDAGAVWQVLDAPARRRS